MQVFSMADDNFRAEVLSYFGAGSSEQEELLAYNRNVFDHGSVTYPIKFPLEDEPFVTSWDRYAAESAQVGVFAVLKKTLVQLHFPIKAGISASQDYQDAVRRGVSTEDMTEATGLELKYPERLHLSVHQTPAGRMPVLVTAGREDFASLVQALTMKNEPGPVPSSMGAATVSGYNNWERIRRYRERWEENNPDDFFEIKWQEEFRRILPKKELYQDRFIILSDGPYSAVAAEDMGFSEDDWRDLSLIIRRDHECTHYFTRRLFASARNYLFDEIMADYMGIVAAAGRYRVDWLLRFLGLESYPHYREGGRLGNYRGDPPLSDGAFKILQALVKSAAENLGRFDAAHSDELRTIPGKALLLTTMTYLTLEALASTQAVSLLEETWRGLKVKNALI
jgi:hypothetical protein